MALREVTPYEVDDGTKSCYYLRTPGESDVNEGFAVTIYRSSTELRSGLSGDSLSVGLPLLSAFGPLPPSLSLR